MSEHQQSSEMPHAPVAFAAAKVAGQMQSSSDHSPANVKATQFERTSTASVEKSVRPPRKAENLPSTSVAQAITQRLAGKE